ncbi:hypothetical protein [Salicibibacter kimchii]|uniref:hypothetical protein n=1 Tax=Salicibibacter kimchii TaxID=2099786 RepID=UPI00135C72F3|nr:hypothetical protein [Salicibibacter kimchii]
MPIQLLIQDELPNEENEDLTLLTDQLKEREQLQHVLMDYFQDSKNNLYKLMFHTIVYANPKIFAEVVQMMQKLEYDPDTQKKINEVVREFEWDKKWMQEGFEKGKEEGLEKGKAEGSELAREKIAKTLLDEGMSTDYISKITGFSVETIKKLEKDRD